MKSTFAASAFAVLASSTAVTAQAQQSVPFYLKLSSDNATIDGRFLQACHTGPATTTLCVGKTAPNPDNIDTAVFFFNSTATNPDQGVLINNYKLARGVDGTQEVISEPFRLALSSGSNVALTWFSPPSFNYGDTQTVKFTSDGLALSTYPDDAKFREGVYPESVGRDASSWYTCWVLAGSYYYNALAWGTGGIPRNPTCQAVKVVKVDVKA